MTRETTTPIWSVPSPLVGEGQGGRESQTSNIGMYDRADP